MNRSILFTNLAVLNMAIDTHGRPRSRSILFQCACLPAYRYGERTSLRLQLIAALMVWGFVFVSVGIAQEPISGPSVVEVAPVETTPISAASEVIAPAEFVESTKSDAIADQAIGSALATTGTDAISSVPSAGPVMLRFSFSGAPWREVLNWLAEESGLALHVGDLPVGSFTYSDPDQFTIDEAISRVNLFLIPQGYAVVKRGSLLSVISLADPRSLQQLDALATSASVDDLGKYSEHEIIKCMVPLGNLVATEAVAELGPLMLMVSPVVLPKSNQLIITETAGKVKNVLGVLQALDVPKVDSVVRKFDLQHVDVATVMMIASSHIGVPSGQTEGLEISISTDLSGNSIYATGTPEKVSRLEEFVKILDVADESVQPTTDMSLRSYPVTGDNLQAIYDVLQTILEGKSLRLSMQPTTKTIVAFADAAVHSQIENTISEMQAPAIDFAVIELNTLDPFFAVTLVTEMFSTPLPLKDSRDSRDNRDVPPPAIPAPRIDADPGNRRLYVRGTADQVAQVKQIVASLDARKTSGEAVRFLPLRGQQKQQVLETAERIWRGDNRVLILPSADSLGGQMGPIERVIHSDSAKDIPVAKPSSPIEGRFEAGAVPRGIARDEQEAFVSLKEDLQSKETSSGVASAGRSNDSPIRSQLIPEGIIIQSDNLEALDSFQEHLMEVAESTRRIPSPPVVYYLKYVNADDAVKMLADLLDGGKTLDDTPANTLVLGSALSMTSGYFGSLTKSKEGMTTVTAGTATIVSDARLNRIIVQGTVEDIAVIDDYMKIIDKGSSITDIETLGRSHVIELSYTKAEDVLAMIKEAFVNRIATKPQSSSQSSSSRSSDRSSSDSRSSYDYRSSYDSRDPYDSRDRRDSSDRQRESAEKPTRGKLPEMTVAAHVASNTIVVTAPDSLFAEVESLVRSIDTMSEQVVEVIPAKDGVDLETILRTLNGESVPTDRSSRGDSRDSSRSDSQRSR